MKKLIFLILRQKIFLIFGILVLLFECFACRKSTEFEYTLNGNLLTDNRDNQQYKVVSIGNKIWMSENYNFDLLGSKFYKDTISKTYGRLYDWNQINTSGFVPKGWRVPTIVDYKELIDNLGGDTTLVGSKLKAIGFSDWFTPNTGATNISGFNGLPGGCFVNNSNGNTGYMYKGYTGIWWIKQEITSDFSYSFRLYFNNSKADINPTGWKLDFYSVRLIKE